MQPITVNTPNVFRPTGPGFNLLFTHPDTGDKRFLATISTEKAANEYAEFRSNRYGDPIDAYQVVAAA